MRCSLLAASCLLLSVSSQAFAADDIVAESHLKAVTVYTNRAALTRQAEVEVPAGAHTIIFKGLSASLLPDSLRAEGKAAADVKFGAVASKIIPADELTNPHEKELNDQLEALQDKRLEIDAEKQALALKQTFLNTLSDHAASGSQEHAVTTDLKPAQWAATAQTVYSGIDDVLKSQIAHDIALRGIDRQIAKVKTELNQLQTGQHSTYQVMIPVEASEATKLTINLSYQLPDATWAPLYDARLDTDKGALELIQYGSVRQKTGEDWNGVQLTLSTAQPQRGTGLPDLRTMWVNVYQIMESREKLGMNDVSAARQVDPAYRKALQAANNNNIDAKGNLTEFDKELAAFQNKTKYGASHLDVPIAIANNGGLEIPKMPETPRSDVLEEWKRVADAGRMKGAKEAVSEQNATFSPAILETGGFVDEYRIPGPSTVKADGTESKLMIAALDTDSKMLIQIKPQLSNEAYLVAHAKLKGEAPIFPGPVSLFLDGAFVGQSRLPLLRPGQENDLAFGIDDQISVKSRVLKDERSETGVIEVDNVQERHFVTELQSLHKKKVTVIVQETIPVPQDKKISAEIEADQTTPGYKEDKDNIKGLLRWEVPLESRQKTDVKLGWKVTWPKDESISGL